MSARHESYSALVVSAMRAVHSRQDDDPLLDDPYGLILITREEQREMAERIARQLQAMGVRLPAGPDPGKSLLASLLRSHPQYGNIILRTRYTDDRIEDAVARGFTQLVVLGAGLDSFALRQTAISPALRIFEMDRPASQEAKRRRFRSAGLQEPANVHFLPVDFERDSFATALSASPFDPAERTFFSWLGVSPYLTEQAHLSTLTAISTTMATEAEIAVNYVRGKSNQRAEIARDEEKIVSRFQPEEFSRLLGRSGFEVTEDLSPAAITRRYCMSRSDGLRPAASFRMVHARKPF